MKILGLDVSTNTGYSLIDECGRLLHYGIITFPIGASYDYDLACEEFSFMLKAQDLASEISHNLIRKYQPDYVFIEQTNLGKNRTTQKLLEFIHYCIVERLWDLDYHDKTFYVSTSAWKSKLKIKMNKEDTKHNKLVKEKKARGKITSKHLSVRWANQTYNLNLRKKDDDIADAIAVSNYGMLYLKENLNFKNTTDATIKKALELS